MARHPVSRISKEKKGKPIVLPDTAPNLIDYAPAVKRPPRLNYFVSL